MTSLEQQPGQEPIPGVFNGELLTPKLVLDELDETITFPHVEIVDEHGNFVGLDPTKKQIIDACIERYEGIILTSAEQKREFVTFIFDVMKATRRSHEYLLEQGQADVNDEYVNTSMLEKRRNTGLASTVISSDDILTGKLNDKYYYRTAPGVDKD